MRIVVSMTDRRNPMIGDFADKPRTDALFTAIDAWVMGLGPVRRTRAAQVKYTVNRGFLWLWAYEKTADGTLFHNVTLDHALHEERVHTLTQVSAHRWNHHVVVTSPRTAESAWLRRLIGAGFTFGGQ